jgi:hypothetical protein
MTTLTKQYNLRYSAEFPKYNYSSTNLGGLFQSEESINDYLDEKVSQGWIILESSIEEI